MPGLLFHVGGSAICPHAGQITVVPGSPRVLVSGMPAATLGDFYPIAACVFTVPPGKPQPCIKVQWLVTAVRVFINGQPAILQTSTGLCQSAEQAPQGPPTVIATQTRVMGI
jgi:uncharacterized Zn-binding protein involved in type VI secretion